MIPTFHFCDVYLNVMLPKSNINIYDTELSSYIFQKSIQTFIVFETLT